ncbi:hypothetical protein GTR02_22155 [Kineococcus sp. R8]|nr:hypothetical protein [Kineococcus vitellinus]NAZ73899.1 hypothetical protein [Kineococcus vitellinus]NAZ84510.1 hypothetical protein [Kineococcus siccus]
MDIIHYECPSCHHEDDYRISTELWLAFPANSGSDLMPAGVPLSQVSE